MQSVHELHELVNEFLIDIRENSINDPPRLAAFDTPPCKLAGEGLGEDQRLCENKKLNKNSLLKGD